jgi:endonuclease/exonuclease/phosphatase family metal-dependent hydrolase
VHPVTKLLSAAAGAVMLVLTASVSAQQVPMAPRNVRFLNGTNQTPLPASTLKVLHWNTHYGGIGSDGVYNPQRVVDWIHRINPDVMSLNEIEKFVPGHGNEDQPALYQTLLTQKTGRAWYPVFAQRHGNWSSNSGGGNLILSRFPIATTARLHMSCSDRSAALATFSVNSREITFVSTHLDSGSATCRSTEVKQLVPWVNGFPEQRILAGDWNQSTDIPLITADYYDGWLVASSLKTAVDFVGNSRPGATHNYRIDKVFSSRAASALTIRSAQVFDTRDANGVTPSDHKPLLVTYEVR